MSIAASSSRSNQRASSSSSRSTTIVSDSASAWQPIMIDDGNGHGCEAKYLTRPQAMPTSSSTSRRTASSIDSPGSAKPARHDHMVGANRGERPSTQRSPLIGSMMTTGSVRGKCSASHDGQSRRQPACTDLRRRAAIRAEAMPRMPADKRLGFGKRRQMLGGDQALHRDRAQIGDFQIVARFERLDRLRVEPKTETRRAVNEAEKYAHLFAAERARLGGRKQRVGLFAVRFEHDEFAAGHIDAGARILGKLLQRRVVAAQCSGAIKRARRIAERRRRTKIRACAHERTSFRIAAPRRIGSIITISGIRTQRATCQTCEYDKGGDHSAASRNGRG